MGHLTYARKCKKCNGIIIKTKENEISKCTCYKIESFEIFFLDNEGEKITIDGKEVKITIIKNK